MSERLLGIPTYCVFERGDFSILKVKSPDTGNTFTVKGYNLPKDTFTYCFTGNVSENQYGTQLDVLFYELSVNTRDDIVKYLTKTVRGVGRVTAVKLYNAFGENVLSDIKDYTKVLSVVNSQKKAMKISESAKRELIEPEWFEIMSRFEISPRVINRLSENFSIDEVKKNPFCLDKYLSFRKKNRMALEMNAGLFSSERFEAAIEHVLREVISKNGDVYAPYDQIVRYVLKLLNDSMVKRVTEYDLKSAFRGLVDKKRIICKKTKSGELVIYSTAIYMEENFIAREIVRAATPVKQKKDLMKAIKEAEDELGITLSDKQREAVKTCLGNSVSIITGSAGTGKTTVLKVCLNAYHKLYETNESLLLAPTGRAAKVMTEKTQHPAYTVHSRLKIDEEGNVNSEITEDIIFIDEMSMCDNHLLYTILMHTENDNARFVFLGDPNQLPSVGAGNVLEDIITSEVIPVIKLDVIHRQAEGSNIIKNSLHVLDGNRDLSQGEDFKFLEVGDGNINMTIVQTFMSELSAGEDVMSCQIITPMKTKGQYCQRRLNELIQQAVNPLDENAVYVTVNDYKFHKSDKVICQKNTTDIKNGDIGKVVDVFTDEDNRTAVNIDFDGQVVTYEPNRLRELGFVLAYAITCHKAQGSEFSSVIMPVGYSHTVMLQRNLMYTAITRASKKMTLVGSKKCYDSALKNNKKRVRLTGLKFFLIREKKKGAK